MGLSRDLFHLWPLPHTTFMGYRGPHSTFLGTRGPILSLGPHSTSWDTEDLSAGPHSTPSIAVHSPWRPWPAAAAEVIPAASDVLPP